MSQGQEVFEAQPVPRIPPPLPRPWRGPFTLDVAGVFGQASAEVRSRKDVTSAVESLHQPPDLLEVIDSQRDALTAGVAEQVARCTDIAHQLHRQIAEVMPTREIARLRALVREAFSLENDKLAANEQNQADLLAKWAPTAQDRPLFRAWLTEWETIRDDIRQSLESSILSLVLTALNEAAAGEMSCSMRVKSFEGLRKSLVGDQPVLTDAYRLVEQRISQQDDGSFGISGPRGVGKTTLIRHFTEPGVMVSAPVAYEPRDFVLHLYAKLCENVISSAGRGPSPLRPPPLPFHPVLLALISSTAWASGVGILAVFIVQWSPPADHKATGIVGMCMLFLATTLGAVTMAEFVELRRLDVLTGSRVWVATATGVLTASGTTLLFLSGTWWSSRAWWLLAGCALTAAGLVFLAIAIAFRTNRMQTARELRQRTKEEELRELAWKCLDEIRYQQTFSRERSGGLKAAGIELAAKHSETFATRPKTFPELVDDLRYFVTAVGKDAPIVIGVDELDKMRSHQEVEDFLNDIKGIFGTTGCFFLVSVSEDAAAGFERRGVPFRDVFDSAFDDVISIEHMDLARTRKVLYGLLLGWTKPLVNLCYVLSGGLARDVRRVARELISHRDADENIELATAALAMCRTETAARIRAIRHELMKDPDKAENINLLTQITGFTPETATAKSLHEWQNKLPRTHRLGLELAAFFLFAATVIEFFDPAQPERIRDAEKPETGHKSLATLAFARQTLAVSPGISLANTRSFREAWDL